jgi:hypothetical protein
MVVVVATLALGSRSKQRGNKVAGEEEAWESRQEEAQESKQEEAWASNKRKPGSQGKRSQGCGPKRSPRMLESVREYEGMNLHTLKAISTLEDGVPEDSRNFREQFQGSKLNEL